MLSSILSIIIYCARSSYTLVFGSLVRSSYTLVFGSLVRSSYTLVFGSLVRSLSLQLSVTCSTKSSETLLFMLRATNLIPLFVLHAMKSWREISRDEALHFL